MKTAVEWLHSEYIKIFGELNPSTAKLLEIAYALEQAKEMEKQQIIRAFAQGDLFPEDYYNPENPKVDCSENYYNETFKLNR